MNVTNKPMAVNHLLERNASGYAKPSKIFTTQTGRPKHSEHDTKVIINLLFARFHHIYTHRYETAYGDEAVLKRAKREWASSVGHFSRDQIEKALERCKLNFAWPPTIAEFITLLQPRPEDLGLPLLFEAYQEACQHSHAPLQHRWSHPVVQLAARETGYFTLRSEVERYSRPLFEQAYQRWVDRVAVGEKPQVEQPIALPAVDDSVQRRLVKRLLKAGVIESEAHRLAYYLDKPADSEVRRRYRAISQQRLTDAGVDLKLPK